MCGRVFRFVCARNRTPAMARTSVLPEATPVGRAIRRGRAKRRRSRAYAGAQEARLGLLAVYIFIRRGAQAALIAWMSGCTPRMAIIRFRL